MFKSGFMTNPLEGGKSEYNPENKAEHKSVVKDILFTSYWLQTLSCIWKSP